MPGGNGKQPNQQTGDHVDMAFTDRITVAIGEKSVDLNPIASLHFALEAIEWATKQPAWQQIKALLLQQSQTTQRRPLDKLWTPGSGPPPPEGPISNKR